MIIALLALLILSVFFIFKAISDDLESLDKLTQERIKLFKQLESNHDELRSLTLNNTQEIDRLRMLVSTHKTLINCNDHNTQKVAIDLMEFISKQEEQNDYQNEALSKCYGELFKLRTETEKLCQKKSKKK